MSGLLIESRKMPSTCSKHWLSSQLNKGNRTQFDPPVIATGRLLKTSACLRFYAVFSRVCTLLPSLKLSIVRCLYQPRRESAWLPFLPLAPRLSGVSKSRELECQPWGLLKSLELHNPDENWKTKMTSRLCPARQKREFWSLFFITDRSRSQTLGRFNFPKQMISLGFRVVAVRESPSFSTP
jgi:hypothetical protein